MVLSHEAAAAHLSYLSPLKPILHRRRVHRSAHLDEMSVGLIIGIGTNVKLTVILVDLRCLSRGI